LICFNGCCAVLPSATFQTSVPRQTSRAAMLTCLQRASRPLGLHSSTPPCRHACSDPPAIPASKPPDLYTTSRTCRYLQTLPLPPDLAYCCLPSPPDLANFCLWPPPTPSHQTQYCPHCSLACRVVFADGGGGVQGGLPLDIKQKIYAK